MINEAFEQANDFFREEEKQILIEIKNNQLTKDQALKRVSSLVKIIKTQEKLETDFDSEYNPTDITFSEEFKEALQYTLLYKEINQLRMKISNMVFPDKLI